MRALPDPPHAGAERPVAVILDVDGTMYDQRLVRAGMLVRLAGHAASRPAAGLACLRALRAYRRAQETLRLRAALDGLAGEEQLQLAARTARLDAASTREHVERWMEREPLRLIARWARPGLRDFLLVARRHGARIGVFSDYPAADKLRSLGIGELVDVVRSAHDGCVGRFKPDPAGLLQVASELEVDPARVVYVGDRPEVDATAAARAGMRCCIIAAAPPPRPATWTAVASFPSLANVLFPSPA